MSEIIDDFLAIKFKSKDGQIVHPGNMGDGKLFARELGNFLYQLHRLSVEGAPAPSFENAFAGAELRFFEAEFDETIKAFSKLVPVELLHEKFDQASKKVWGKPAVWVHGNFLPRNLLIDQHAKLAGVTAFDKAVKGDPACDLAIAWLLFDRKNRKIFFAASEADEQMIERARLFAVRNALKMYHSDDIDELIQSRDSLSEILKDYGYSGEIETFDELIRNEN